jgi:hypothetical protein
MNKRKEATNLFLQEKISLVLEPPIDTLITYPKELTAGGQEFHHRHWYLTPEVKQVLYDEQKKYAINLKVNFIRMPPFLCD